MKNSLCILATLILLSTTFGSVRMGSGIMTFDTVTGWGLGSDGKSVLGPTHGSVVIDKAGNIYTSADKGVVVFNPSGKVLRSFIDEEHSNLHDMEIREEDGVEYIYGARNKGGVGIKFEAQSGDIVLTLGLTNESGLALTTLKPTAITVAPSAANISAVSRPIPDDAPATRTVFPVKFISGIPQVPSCTECRAAIDHHFVHGDIFRLVG